MFAMADRFESSLKVPGSKNYRPPQSFSESGSIIRDRFLSRSLIELNFSAFLSPGPLRTMKSLVGDGVFRQFFWFANPALGQFTSTLA